MTLSDLFETEIPSHIKASDIPPAMRNRRLTMKDIEAERPKGAYRFRVGEKEFMDQRAAQEFAAGTGQKVVAVREAQKKNLKSESKKDACYHKVKSRYKVWPSAYASGALVQCRKQGADSWGTGGKGK